MSGGQQRQAEEEKNRNLIKPLSCYATEVATDAGSASKWQSQALFPIKS